jgi:hypothetical protein
MYISIPFKKFNEEKLSFRKKKKKDKDYIKIVYLENNIMINDIYIESPIILCKDKLQCYQSKMKNKFLLKLICPKDFIKKILIIENKIQDYMVNNITSNRDYTSIIDRNNGNIININLFKDIYTGFNIYSDKNENDYYPVDSIDKNKRIKITLAFNYIWINDYNYGLSWRIISMWEPVD